MVVAMEIQPCQFYRRAEKAGTSKELCEFLEDGGDKCGLVVATRDDAEKTPRLKTKAAERGSGVGRRCAIERDRPNVHAMTLTNLKRDVDGSGAPRSSLDFDRDEKKAVVLVVLKKGLSRRLPSLAVVPVAPNESDDTSQLAGRKNDVTIKVDRCDGEVLADGNADVDQTRGDCQDLHWASRIGDRGLLQVSDDSDFAVFGPWLAWAQPDDLE